MPLLKGDANGTGEAGCFKALGVGECPDIEEVLHAAVSAGPSVTGWGTDVFRGGFDGITESDIDLHHDASAVEAGGSFQDEVLLVRRLCQG
ncbi:MAG: hypothetical protein U0R19_28565 [Bryobacteraceae bacterium]